MRVILDERETSLYNRLMEVKPAELAITKQVLLLGDILLQSDDERDFILLERKTYADLLASIKDGRYAEQSYRLTHTSQLPLHHIVYVLEGQQSLLRPHEKKIVEGSIASIQFIKGFSVMKTSSLNETAAYVLSLADKIERDLKKGKTFAHTLSSTTTTTTTVIPTEGSDTESPPPTTEDYCQVVKKAKKDNLTPENMGHVILTQIPGVSAVNAVAIMKGFNNFAQFYEHIRANPAYLDGLHVETAKGKLHKMSKTVIANVKLFLL